MILFKEYNLIKKIFCSSVFSTAAISLLIILGTGDNTFAETYKIRKGDTLSSISKKHKISIDEIKKINGLKGAYLKAGSVINLPSKSKKAVHPSKSSAESQNNLQSKDNIPTPFEDDGTDILEYIVQKGDTLYEIARANNTTVKELKLLNELKRDSLRIGQRLLIPVNNEPLEVREEEETKIDARTVTIKKWVSDGDEESKPTANQQNDLASFSRKERLMLFARKFLDIPYRFGGSSILGIDCSAFVQKVFDFLNIPLPRTAKEQFYMGNDINREDLTIGDLVFFRTYAKFPSHVGIYIGDNLFIHASSVDKKVRISNLDEPYYLKRFLGAKRVIETQDAEWDSTELETNLEAEKNK